MACMVRGYTAYDQHDSGGSRSACAWNERNNALAPPFAVQVLRGLQLIDKSQGTESLTERHT